MTLNRMVSRTGTVLTVLGIAEVIVANQAPICGDASERESDSPDYFHRFSV